MPEISDDKLIRDAKVAQITMTQCEACNGVGKVKVTGFIQRKGGCHYADNEPMRCLGCEGSGQVSELALKMRRIGQFIRDYRVKMRISQKEQAELLGMTFSELNDIQHGRF